ncbi:MAG: hypothetical protein MT490_08020 [Sphingomonas sp.]|uniref:hypothetical protein n=1 Tax=Sphingomonas sp. TaxID=28214 RepID=UPI0022737A23|nr:hypothetical protein [Sphingomonas sp.]MCX8475730.1 hypothetical protein [Sphingomonas sp.]
MLKSLALRSLAGASLLVLSALPASAQQQQQAPAAAPADPFAGIPAAKAEDVASIDAILAALYGTISGDVGQKRDWDRFRSLFYPGARLIPTGTPKDSDVARARMLTPEDYIARSGPLLERIGFHEIEIARRTDRFGHVAQVFSTYDGKSKSGEMPAIRGINSIQLFNDGKRWWIVNVYWMQESEKDPIPKAYLPVAR